MQQGNELTNRFTHIELDDYRYMQGCILHAEQRDVMQNLLADAALEKNALELDPYKPLYFIQMEADLAGQIKILELILENHDAAIINIAEQVENNRSNNTDQPE